MRTRTSADRNTGEELQAVMAASALVQHQPDAVVSRVVLKNGGGSVTAFAFDAGQALSEHTTPFEALMFVIDGEAEILVADRLHRVSAGQLVHLPGGEPHAVKALTRAKMMLVMLRP
jgi:quercetin dioxygenase-like cupin family protein